MWLDPFIIICALPGAFCGNIEPLYTANLYARVDGYLERRNVDIGTKVHAGEVLAVISSPEIDLQLSQARATLAQSQTYLLQARAALEQAKANAELARLTKERDVPLGLSAGECLL